MRIDILTLFPEMCDCFLRESIIGRARERGCVEIYCRDIRDYTLDKHNRVDDAPYGGGTGMIIQVQPVFSCYEALCEDLGRKPHLIYMSPQGKTLTQTRLKELSEFENVCVLCGHYEGVDQRLIDEFVDEQISIGDYVLTGGELPALVFTDSLCRMLKGVLSDEECFERESHYNGLLEHPQYTRPPVFMGKEVPEVLTSGHHQNIEYWRLEQSLKRTKERRPDLYEKYISENKDKLDKLVKKGKIKL